MNWVEIKVKTTTEAIEAVSNIFYEAGVAGVVIEDPKIYLRSHDPEEWDYLDIPEGLDFEVAQVTGYLIEDSSLAERTQSIRDRISELPSYGLDIGKGEVVLTTISETDWSSAWKKYYKPTHIGKNIVIKPSWEVYKPERDEIVVELDPGMAFGTGTHETTMLCLEILEKYIKKDITVIDVGCGSGILSIASGKLGAKQVLAIDRDENAVRIARENIKRNNLETCVRAVKGDKLQNINFKADIIVANIIADVIIDLSKDAALYLKDNGVFIASGIIKDRKLSVIEALEKNGFDLIEQFEKGEWVALVSTQAPIGD
ncbi:Ribosomal protein L11 methyltransferase [Tepidanaerobacter acetatoxydans Re1]|uniref:Ribosomal protein L11 methyltransferase n=1 Tax=Tepidanaerobacter acetatoxydans (strain DSM 21804 / JCM 16047 / Re1) TaxID=1209989 RepID=F4LSH9_TEPAE|nr:50S ribosomal protein L11 methyltransferase [Tepidanaerobacter acetatoxydans]AEE91245.1 Ribosomal protein L11 methyltransferase [Tepidanaerobacter acetatoxydans Re1]CCP25923.1 Ribosomal protein L11 methyltransferase [Tepidanaerobacter acetatoxydans Re1]